MSSEVQNRVHAYFRGKGLRRTVQRDAIVEAAFSTTEHFTADLLLEMARRISPAVSRATVYRTLPLLVESGLLREMDFGRDYKFYDPNFVSRPRHNHLICTDCSKIVEFEDAHIDVLEDCISRRLGFSPEVKTVTIEASCQQFREAGQCEHRSECHGHVDSGGRGRA